MIPVLLSDLAACPQSIASSLRIQRLLGIARRSSQSQHLFRTTENGCVEISSAEWLRIETVPSLMQEQDLMEGLLATEC